MGGVGTKGGDPKGMILAVDAGNTHIVFGLGQPQPSGVRGEWVALWRLHTDWHRTEDEYFALSLPLLQQAGVTREQIEGVVIASVVPPIERTLRELSARLCPQRPPLFVTPEAEVGIAVRYTLRQELGADRLVNALAVKALYGCPAIVVDFGTATTFDVLSAEGEYLGGAICPGVGIAVEALSLHTARLPRIDLVAPSRAIGRTTQESMQSGIILGCAEMTDGLIRRFAEELGEKPKVVATGGLAPIIAPHTKTIQQIDPELTLEGLRIYWNLLQGSPGS